MAKVFPLKAILDTRSARFLLDVSGVDTPNPRLKKNRSIYDMSSRKSISFISRKSSHASEHFVIDESAATLSLRKHNIMHCLGIIVEDSVDQMAILSSGRKSEHCLRKFHLSLKERIAQMLYEDPIYDMETGDSYEYAFTRRKINKNFDDCAICREFLAIIKNELRNEKQFTSVRDIMSTIVNTKEAESELLRDEANNYTKMKNFKHMLITHSRDYQLQMHKVNETLSTAKDRTQELLFENLLRVRYMKNWENARQEQNTLSCRKSEKDLEDIITKYRLEIEKEIRIHSEIDTFISENLVDLEGDIKYWISRYDKEMESRNIKIQIARDHKEDQEKKFQQLKDIFALHKKQIAEFKLYKNRKQIEDEIKLKEDNAAIKIQAWWRGIMVRHKLGPFNPKKKGKKGKDKKKKKK